MADTKHFDWPFRFSDQTGHAVENEQDTIDDIAVCIAVAFLVEPTYRIEVPTFGVPSQIFNLQPLDLETMIEATQLWESRGNLVLSQLNDQSDPTHLTDRVTALLALRDALG